MFSGSRPASTEGSWIQDLGRTDGSDVVVDDEIGQAAPVSTRLGGADLPDDAIARRRGRRDLETGFFAQTGAVDDAAVDHGESDLDLLELADEPPVILEDQARRRSRLRKAGLIVAAAAVTGLTVGGGTVAAMTKSVAIVVDGQTQHVSTLSGSVAGALDAAGITPGVHDTLAPGVGTPIFDGSTIVLARGRLLTLTIDGQSRQIWTTARTVDAALGQLGGTSNNLSLSADRSREIPLDGLSVTATTIQPGTSTGSGPSGAALPLVAAGGSGSGANPSVVAGSNAPLGANRIVTHRVALAIAGHAPTAVVSPALTVAALLAEQKVTLGSLDRVSPARTARITNGTKVSVTRVAAKTVRETISVPQPADTTVESADLDEGTSGVSQGRPGTQIVTYRVTTVNGKQSSKKEISRMTAVKAQPTVTTVGTKAAPVRQAPAPAGDAGFTYVGDEVFTNDTSFGVNWDGLANCESTHNPRAVNANPSAGLPTYGLFQFDIPTWESVGGSGNPMDASPQEQLQRAKLLFQQRGLEPWACRDSA